MCVCVCQKFKEIDQDNLGIISIKMAFKAISRECQHLPSEARKTREIQAMNSAFGHVMHGDGWDEKEPEKILWMSD